VASNWPEIPQWAVSVGVIVLAIGGGWVGGKALLGIARRLVRLTETRLDDFFVEMCGPPIKALGPLLGLSVTLPLLKLPESLHTFLTHWVALVFIGLVAWFGIRVTKVGEAWILGRYDISITDNLRARAIQTQVRIIRRVVMVVLLVFAVASGLMTFEKVKQLGTSILASAGIAGIILGLAAQRTISTLLAGLQVAITQPIRIDDVLVVENEWGRVEEITLTYVVVRIWDLRRLVLPITYFIEKPFQNWTRVSAEILGSVFLYVDYTVPVQALREELHRIVAQSNLWDGKVCVLQVTNSTDRTMEVRALVSAEDSSKAWDLRCLVREKLISFLQERYPECLPRLRATLEMGGNAQHPAVQGQAKGDSP